MAGHHAAREPVQPTFADLLRRHRRAMGLTQEELAERAVMSARGVRYLERALRLPYPDTVRRLADALELAPAEAQVLRSAATRKRPGPLMRRIAASVLPVPYGDIIGRDAEVLAAVDLIRQPRVRVVTITGAGGVGKTRLAVEVAETLEPEYADGVLWVPLGGLDAANQVGAAVAQALGGREPGGLAEEDALVAKLQQAHALLLLDTFEHVISAAPLIAALAARCAHISMLVTSRSPLRLTGEHEFRLDTLPVPPLGPTGGATAISGNAAVRLFSERAKAIARDFVVDDSNAASVAQICRRLDGLPLALELAAARIRLLRPEEMLIQLERALDLLTDGPVDAAARHRSLRNTLAWSYALLDATAQQLLRRLSVFAGGCTLAAISAVCVTGGDESFNLVDAMDALQRSSLLRREDTGRSARYVLLDTIREFAGEQLTADPGEASAVRSRHAEYYSTLAETLGARIEGPGQADAVTAIEEEHDNVRAALGWWRDRRDVESGLRLANALWMFWYIRGYASEGRDHLNALLALPGSVANAGLRAKGLLGAGQLARDAGDYAAARALMEESVALYRTTGDQSGLRQALFGAGFVARTQEEHIAARELFGEALASARNAGDDYVAALALHHLGMMSAQVDDDPGAARPLLEESLDLFRRVGFPRHIALVLGSLGDVERAEQHYDRAAALLCESWTVMIASGQAHDIHWTLDVVAQLSFERGATVRAVRLAAAATAIRRNSGAIPPAIAHRRDQWLGRARESLGGAAFDDAWRVGLAWSPEEAAAYAKAGDDIIDVTAPDST